MRFGTDGVRGRANTELTASFALNLGRATARVLQAEQAVVGGDSRVSTPMLEAAFCAGLAAEGVNVVRLGVVPTPLVAFEAAQRGAMGAVISASHNPYHDNGIKVFAVGGTKLPDAVEAQIEAVLADLSESSQTAGAPSQQSTTKREVECGTIVVDEGHDAYVDHVLTLLEGRSLAPLKVIVDAANGAASPIAANLFARTGATVTVIHDQPNGVNINDGCGATSPQELAAEVVAHGADVGLALDGDADRLIAVDENGRIVDGDHVLAICAEDLRARGRLRDDTVVVTVMSNLGFRLAMDAADIRVVETAVGDRYVLEALQAGSYSLGGEQSGHVIFAEHATTGDGMLTALALLDVMARSGRKLSAIAADAMTSLPQVLVNVEVAHRRPDIADLIAHEIAIAEGELGDHGRVLIRPSGTEPLVRIMVEAPTHTQASNIADRLALDVIRHCDRSAS